MSVNADVSVSHERSSIPKCYLLTQRRNDRNEIQILVCKILAVPFRRMMQLVYPSVFTSRSLRRCVRLLFQLQRNKLKEETLLRPPAQHMNGYYSLKKTAQLCPRI
jgi:hypothetical protein